MKGAGYSEVLNDLVEGLEETLKAAKENDLCHLIEPLEETISKVKELNRGREVKCELIGECNSETCDLHMACSCNDWGPDKLGPDGKWICEICGTDCFCDQIWGSCTHLSKKEPVKKPLDVTNKKKDISLTNKNFSEQFQKDSFVKGDPCVCGVSRKTENQNRRNKTSTPSNASAFKIIPDPSKKIENEGKTNKKTLNQSASGTKCNTFIHININKKFNETSEKEVSVLYEKKQKSEEKLSCKEVRGGSAKKEAKSRKCLNCKCTHDEKGNKIKSDECRDASERKNKLMTGLEKENNVNEVTKAVEIKISHSTVNFSSYGNTPLHVLAFEKKGKCGNVTCKSSSVQLLDSKDQRYWDEIKAKNEERKAQKISKYAEKPSQNVPDKYESSLVHRNLQRPYSEFSPERTKLEKPEKPLKFSEISGSGRVRTNDEPTRNFKKIKPPCNRCAKEIEKTIDTEKCSPASERVKMENEHQEKLINCSKLLDRETAETNDEPTRNFRKIKPPCNRCVQDIKKTIDTEKCSPGSERVKMENEHQEKLINYSKLLDCETAETNDEPTRNFRKIKPPCNRCVQDIKKTIDTEKCSPGSERVKMENEHHEKLLNCSKLLDRETAQTSDEPTRNFTKIKPPCNRCAQEIKKPIDTENFSPGSERVKMENEHPQELINYSKLPDHETVQKKCSPGSERVKMENEPHQKLIICSKPSDCETVQKNDGNPTQDSATVKRQKLQEKAAFPGEDLQKETSRITEGQILNQNFQQNPCNYSNPSKSKEKQCVCGCGYFLKGVPTAADGSCPCSNSLKISDKEEKIRSKESYKNSRKNDCEGCCEWCSSQ